MTSIDEKPNNFDIDKIKSIAIDQTEIEESSRRFQFHDFVEPFKNIIPIHLHTPPDNLLIYRTCIAVPPNELDHLPNILKNRTADDLPPKFTYEEVERMSEERQKTALFRYCLSVNSTPEDAVRKFYEQLDKHIGKGWSNDKIDNWIHKRGINVICLNMNQNHGLISDFSDSHGNILLYEDVKLSDMMVESFAPIKIDCKYHGIDK